MDSILWSRFSGSRAIGALPRPSMPARSPCDAGGFRGSPPGPMRVGPGARPGGRDGSPHRLQDAGVGAIDGRRRHARGGAADGWVRATGARCASARAPRVRPRPARPEPTHRQPVGGFRTVPRAANRSRHTDRRTTRPDLAEVTASGSRPSSTPIASVRRLGTLPAPGHGSRSRASTCDRPRASGRA